ncbi:MULTISPECIES: DUF4920 domain-containing protein [unclassified Croceitalea]|uniref:DUF4920 domain-containing protein n=1 Tax=unclassified Croceitalea TaxID=2632280 RepID=UPI0030DDC662
MKRFNILAIILMIGFSNTIVFAQQNTSSTDYELFGADFEKEKGTTKDAEVYQNIKAKDTVITQLVGNINEVCQAKGCWMKVNLPNNEEVFVKFKDYGFFVPLDASGRQVVMNGKAFLEEVSVDEQRHYAKDKGASEDEISRITEPKKTLRFEADGVLIKK